MWASSCAPLQQLFIDSVMGTAEAKLVSGKYEEMIGLLQGYRQKVYEEWKHGAGQNCHFNLEQPLILRDPNSSLLSVNFSEEVSADPSPEHKAAERLW